MGGAATMGLGIWSMHFLGMLALDLRRPVHYRLDLVAVSMLAAVLGAGVALWVIARPGARRSALFTAAAFMGAAVAAMHYCGMASMEVDAQMSWKAPLVIVSLFIAYGASLFALWLVFAQRGAAGPWLLHRRLAAALAVGLGVSGLHYTAMAAVRFQGTMGIDHQHGLNTNSIAALLVVASAVMLVILLVGAQLDQRRAALANDLTAVAKAIREIGRSGDARERICRALRELTGATTGGLLEPDGTGKLVMTASSGAASEALSIDLAGPSAGADVHRSGEPAFVPEAASGSVLYEPVVLDGVVVGVLLVAWTRRVRRLEDRSISVAGLLAAEAAFVIERADLIERLERLARTDELTGLANRRTADEELERFLARAARRDEPLAVAMLDIDHFKAYNDTHGHVGGDRMLTAAAEAWTGALRAGDLLARYGGEEFVAFSPDCGLQAGEVAAERLRTALAGAVTCSVGVALWDGVESSDQLLARADAALYAAKSSGRDRTVVAEPGLVQVSRTHPFGEAWTGAGGG